MATAITDFKPVEEITDFQPIEEVKTTTNFKPVELISDFEPVEEIKQPEEGLFDKASKFVSGLFTNESTLQEPQVNRATESMGTGQPAQPVIGQRAMNPQLFNADIKDKKDIFDLLFPDTENAQKVWDEISKLKGKEKQAAIDRVEGLQGVGGLDPFDPINLAFILTGAGKAVLTAGKKLPGALAEYVTKTVEKETADYPFKGKLADYITKEKVPFKLNEIPKEIPKPSEPELILPKAETTVTLGKKELQQIAEQEAKYPVTSKDLGSFKENIELPSIKQNYTKGTKQSEVYNEPVRLQADHIEENIKQGYYTYNEWKADLKAYYDSKVAKLSERQQKSLENEVNNRFSERNIDNEINRLEAIENLKPEKPSKLDQLAEEWGISEQEKPILSGGKNIQLDTIRKTKEAIINRIVKENPNMPQAERAKLIKDAITPDKIKQSQLETGLEQLRKSQTIESQSGAFLGKQEKFKSQVPMDNPESEQLFQIAKGIKQPNIIQKVKVAATEIGHKFTRVYEHLEQKTGKNAQLIFDLKRLEKARNTVADSTTRDIGEVLAKANKSDYDIFNRKIILNDLKSDVEKGLYKNKELPFKLTPESLNKELNKLDEVIKSNPILQETLIKRQKMWDDFKPQYVDAMKPYKIGVEDMFTDNYYRHDVLDYVTNNGIFGTGKKLQTPVKGYMKERTGYSGLYNTDYLEAEHQILAQMKYDAEVANTLTKIKKYEDITKSVKKTAKEQGLKDWHKAIPEGYRTWQPKEGSVFYPAMTVPENTAKQIMEDEILKIADVKEQLKQVLAVGGKRPEWVVRNEVADTLDNLVRDRTKGIVSSLDLGLMSAWKRWQLLSPRRFLKYNIRNTSGDAEAVFIGNPSAFKETPSATKELYDVFFRKQEMSPDMKKFFDRGGMSSTLQAQEMDDLKQLWMYSRLYNQKSGVQNIWKEYWNKARKFTDFRESILRYSAFKDFKKQLIEGNGIPKSYGASNPKMIDALKDIDDKAYWLSNDLLGAYDMVSVAGHVIRERAIPFWSWQEVNFKRYLQLYKNAANDERLTIAIGKKLGATTPRIAFKMGSLAVKVAGLTSALAVYNNTFYPEEEAELSKDIKKYPHIVLGRDDKGRIQYFNRLGTLDDFTSWFGLDYTPQLINDYRKGRYTFKELLQEQGEKSLKAIPNKLTGQAIPITKLTYETATRRSTWPDIFKPGTVRDRALNLARSFSLENEYTAMAGLPSRGYEDTLKDFVMYKIDPGEAAYRDVYDLKNDFLKKTGKQTEGFWLTPQGDAFYNMKLAVKYEDKKAFSKYFNILADELKEQEKLGNIGSSIVGIVTGMNPLSGLNPIEQAKFIKGLDEENKTKLDRAMDFYKETLSNIKGMDFKIKE